MDLTELSNEELSALRDDIDAERRIRDTLEIAPARAEQAARDYLAARDREHTGAAPWQQPTGAHDLYPQGYRVTHNGTTWESTRAANSQEPGTGDGWTEPPEEPDGGAA